MMYDRPQIEARRTAIVVVDMVNWMFTWRAPSSPVGSNPEYQERIETVVIPNNRRLIHACRAAGVQVVYVRVGTTSPDFIDAIPGFRGITRHANAHRDSDACRIVDELAVEYGDLDLLKMGSGGFTSSALDLHLRRLGIEHVIYTGVSTSACVLLTAMTGFDLGYHGYLVTDATAAKTPDMHQAALSILGDFYALGVTTQQMMNLLAESAAKQHRQTALA